MRTISNIDGRPGDKVLLLGNEAIARGLLEGGVRVASSYPGTPASEILSALISVAEKYNIYAEWSTNEKVAAEVAISAAMCGLRSMVSMKGVGVNVASEPFQAFTYMGTEAGIVLISADDVGMHSSHTEQDNRLFAREAYLPIFEPPGPKGAHEMVKVALDLSEKWKQPVLFRTTTRIGHSSADVVLGPISRSRKRGRFRRIPQRWVNLPANARKMRLSLIERMENIRKEVEKLPFNKIIFRGDGELGVVSCGVTHNVVREAFKLLDLSEEVGLMRIGTPHPLPKKLVKQFLSSNRRVLVVEETEPMVETCLRSISHEFSIETEVHGKDILPKAFELDAGVLLEGLARFLGRKPPSYLKRSAKIHEEAQSLVPPRPPVLCPGCTHRVVFFAINQVEKNLKLKRREGIIKPSDIGCYTLGYQSPLHAVDTNFCMGSSIGISAGLSHVVANPIICTIGDSTFFHSGIPALLNAVFNKADITILVLDNSTTAMTGFQTHPGVGLTAMGEETKAVRIEDLATACGADMVEVVDSLDLDALVSVLEKAVKTRGVSVVIARHPCILLEVRKKGREKVSKYKIDQDMCTKCQLCMNVFGCPAFRFKGEEIRIDPDMCNGCGVCANVMICPQLAIKEVRSDGC